MSEEEAKVVALESDEWATYRADTVRALRKLADDLEAGKRPIVGLVSEDAEGVLSEYRLAYTLEDMRYLNSLFQESSHALTGSIRRQTWGDEGG